MGPKAASSQLRGDPLEETGQKLAGSRQGVPPGALLARRSCAGSPFSIRWAWGEFRTGPRPAGQSGARLLVW